MELSNQYCSGYVLTPIIEVCQKYGLFDLLVNRKGKKLQEIIVELKANGGYLTIALQALESLGWLEKNTGGAYRLKKHVSIGNTDLDLTPLYAIDPQELVSDPAYARMFSDKIEKMFSHVENDDGQFARILEGAIIVPLISALKRLNVHSVCREIAELEPQLARSIEKLFISRQWMTVDKNRLTVRGKELLQTSEFEISISFRNLLSSMEDLLFGDHKHTHRRILHIRKESDILSSDMDQAGYRKDLLEKVVAIFDELPLEQQPKTVVHVGCGDGSLLKEVYLLICKTIRGQHLTKLPIQFIAVDYDQHELEKASKILTKEGVKHYTLLGETKRPGKIYQTLERNGLTSREQTLFIQSFFGRHLRFDAKQKANDALSFLANDRTYYLDDQGRSVDHLTVISCWQRYLRAVAQGIGKSPLLLLENCSFSPISGKHILSSLAHEYLISAEVFITLAASVGLFNQSPAKYYKGITNSGFHHLSKRDYTVRIANTKDLKTLYQLEELCWPEQLRTPNLKIRHRLKRYPQGQFVLEKDGKVLGVIYSQRIVDAEELEKCNMDNVHSLHMETGLIIQLLAVNIHPEAQNFNYGDQLLEFMLQRCSLIDGVKKIVAVSLCKNYNAKNKVSFKNYIRQQGKQQDPILAFHQSHGANIVKALPGYRPRDISNRGYGVLIEYNDLQNRIKSFKNIRTPENRLSDGKGTAIIDREKVNEFILGSVVNFLDVHTDSIDIDRPLMEMGLNSVDLLSLQRQIEEKFHLYLQPGFFFEYSNCRKVVAYLVKELDFVAEVSRSARASGPSATQALKRNTQQSLAHAKKGNQTIADSDIAVIGISCKLPGGIDSPDKLWRLLTSEKCVIGSFPKERGAWPGGIDKTGITHGGFIDNGDAFDASFFRISPKEAQIMDPQQRILLELAWACFEDANIIPSTMKGTKTGVFVGASNSDYSRLVQDFKIAVEAHNAVGNSLAVLANRISYYFDLTGPSLLIDTACSSSLVALHTAIQSLRSGECSEALVGGVNFICHPDLSISYYKAGMLSPDGRCKVFDAEADGYVRSEGAVVMLLKPLRKAVEDQNQIHAVIKGSSINHGGLAAGLTVPNPRKQSELLVAAWKNAGVSAEDITYIEAHGTGTSLGDPIEMEGILTAHLQVATAKQDQSCGIGSIKSNLGHLESAAGLTGLVKVILSMKNQALPATINFSTLNPKIRFEDTRFYIQDKFQRWETKQLYLAGVSSFGSGGTNAHVVVQQYIPNVNISSLQENHLFVLSAISEESLHEYAAKVIEWLEEFATDTNFCDAIYSWQTGRTVMKHRLAIKVKDRRDLTNKLKQWVEGNIATDTWCGVAKSSMSNPDIISEGKGIGQSIEQSISKRDIGQLAILWTSGIDIDWQMLYLEGGEKVNSKRLISLPTYPFARGRYWINSEVTDQSLVVEVDKPKDNEHVLLAAPTWRQSKANLSADAGLSRFTQRYVFLCDMPQINARQIEALFSNSHCLTLSTQKSDIANQYIETAIACFQEIKKILSSKQSGDALIQIVAAHTDEQTLFAGLSGMLKTVNLERPSLIGQIILTDGQITTDRLCEQLLENQLQPQELIIKYESDIRYVIRWETVKSTIEKHQIVFNNHGTYLITGGLGGLGILFAKEILHQTTDANVILIGRSKLTDAKGTVLEQLSAGSSRVSYVQTDINELDQVKELIATIKKHHKRLNGIIHCAGENSGNYIFNKTVEEFSRILKTKVTGTYNLDIATQDSDLDFFVLFSSIASVIGLQGLADYATANGFMDHFATYRNCLAGKNRRQGKTLSVNWPLWREGGMAMNQSSQDRLRDTIGMLPMETNTGIRSLHRMLSLQYGQLFIMKGIASKGEAAFAELNQPFSVKAKTRAGCAPNAQLLHEKTLQKIKQLFGKVISLSVSKIDENETLLTYGIDSIFITHLNRELARFFGGLSKTLFFEYKTLADVTAYLTRDYAHECLSWTGLTQDEILLQKTDNIEPPNAIGSFSVRSKTCNLKNDGGRTHEQQVAIIGISGMYPQAANLDEYWENFRIGRNCISEIPSDRWDLEKFYDPDRKSAVEKGKSYCKWGGFVEQFSQFDPLFFGISPREAMNIDPQERLFLQASWQALESSGYTRSDLKNKYNKKVGVFAGITKTGFDSYGSQFSNEGEQFHPRTSFGSIANRVSYFLDITGASMPIDTMCSSSLTAIHEACEHINRGECNLAFAGGVNLYLHPSTYVWLSAQHMLSKDGLCRSFGAGANGFVPGEGVGVVLLKPLTAAIQDNDTIHGVILASHINHGGKTNGYFVPNPGAHAELIRHTIDKAGISAREISYIEAHGTGTELGDPIEISGLEQAFGKDTQDTSYCKIGSTKSNIGHLEAAAGIAGLTKILLQMKHGQIAPSLHSEVLNPNIDFTRTPFIVNQALATWDAPLINGQQKPRIAGISSFGAGGVNAHVIVQEYVALKQDVDRIGTNASAIIPLSARTEKQLKQRAKDLLKFIRLTQPKTIDLHATAYTLQVGREAMDERLGFIVNSVDDLAEKLEDYIAGEVDIECVFQGQLRNNKHTVSLFNTDIDFQEMIDKWIDQKKLAKLLDLWVKGIDLDWNKFYDQSTPGRITLPTYPFADERYWIDSLKPIEANLSAAAASILHPLLHTNTSDLYQQSYTTTFNGEEFFIRDHKIHGQSVLPAFAYLEMATAAVVRAMPASDKSAIVELHNVAWPHPIVASDKRITIALSASENERVTYEMFNADIDDKTILCQGHAIFSGIIACDKIDIEQLKRQMRRELSDASFLYSAFSRMGINYGRSFQTLGNIYLGNNQLLAEIRLASTADGYNYCLHPSIMDSALQACIILVVDLNNPPIHPLQPTKVESISILSGCTTEMSAWIRYATATGSEDEIIKLDIDLCDQNGNVCVKMKGVELVYSAQSFVGASLNESTNEVFEKLWDKRSYLYRWEESASVAPKIPAAHNNILIVSSGSSFQFENAILDYYDQNRNCHKTLIRLSDKTKLESKNEWLCGIRDVEGFQTCLRNIEGIDALYFLSMKQRESGSVSLTELSESQESNEIQLLRLIKCLKEENRIKESVDTYILTLDKYSIDDSSSQPLGAGVTGFAYSLAQGNYQFRVRNLDLSSADLEKKQGHRDLFSSIIKESPADRGEVFRIQSGKRFRQTFYKLNWNRTDTPNIKHNGVYLIVGGSGTVGQIVTRNLLQKYKATVIWIGRSSGDSQNVLTTLESFGELGQNLAYVQADVTDLDSMHSALESIKKEHNKINGAIFSGMVFDFENSIVQTSEADFRSIVDIKTKGCWVFHKVLENHPLDFMCYFSSGQAYSFSGAAKLVGYATAITSSDSLVRSLQKVSKFPVGIINWGYWKDTVKKLGETTGSIRTDNFDALEGEEGFECFERFVSELHRGGLNQVLCLNVSPQVGSLMHCSQEEIISVTNDGLVRQKKADKHEQQGNGSLSLPAEKSINQIKQTVTLAKPSGNIMEYVCTNILNCLSNVLRIVSESIDPSIAFSDYGVDSILGVKFIDQVNASLSISLNTAIIFEYASVKRLSEHIVVVYRGQVEAQMNGQEDLFINEESKVVKQENVVPKRIAVQSQRRLIGTNRSLNSLASQGKRGSSSEIAVVGMSGKFPKAENIQEFWQNLIKGVDGIEELPAHYLDQANYFSTEKQRGKTRCKWGGILAERDCFDPLFFNISPKEAESMNPHQRLVLQESWKALEDAGYNPKDLSGHQTGVFIGAEPTAYLGDGFTGYSDAIIASRLSYIVNLRGPSIVVNTGCSSSAVALHLACESLRNRESDIALAGGVHACMGQYVQIILDQIEMLSPSGRCFTFDDAGDGTILSEGIGIVVLKRLEDAIASGDLIYGVICGSGINQDGASNGITAPNGAAQEELFTSVYEKFQINPENISYVEAHGTATKLGDPVEANALVRTFRKFSDKKEYCAVGSVKSYIGHTSAAAGVVGLIRILLSIQHKQIPKLLHFKNLNPLIEFKNSPFFINTVLSDWKSPENIPRMAALNSFGHSGTNAHLVIKEYIPTEKAREMKRVSTPSGDVIIPLSAKTTEQLRQKVYDLLTFISTTNGRPGPFRIIDLEAVAYTLQTGREAMEERLGFVVSSINQLAWNLQSYLDGFENADNFYRGSVKLNKNIGSLKKGQSYESADQLLAVKDLSGLVKLWVNGLEPDWTKLYAENKPKRVSLPTYPFAKEKYWIDTAILPDQVFRETKSSFIHSLLHNNTSDLIQHRYSSIFSGKEFFLRDHQVNGQKLLPGVAYLEMARAAAHNATPFTNESNIIELHNVVWAQPIVVEEKKAVSIELVANDEDNGVVKQIDYEIHTSDFSRKVVHSQGQIVITAKPTLAKLDLPALKGQMSQGIFEKPEIYQIFEMIGIDFGPSHQSLVSIHLGEKQLLAELTLPEIIGNTLNDYILHPSMLDGALQSCNGLMVDFGGSPCQSVLPYAVKTVRILTPCTKHMNVWVRFSNGSNPGDKIIKLDIDLCDLEGNICVQMLEFSTRLLENGKSFPNGKSDSIQNGAFYNDTFYAKVITQILNREISVEEAVGLE